MSEPDFDAALAKLRRDRLRFEGLPDETPLQILEDAVERLSLTPEAAKWEEGAIGGADTLLGVALTAAGVPAPVGGLGVKGLDFALHALLSIYLRRAKAHQDALAQQARNFASS